MKHFTYARFWGFYAELPKEIQELADKNYQLLKADPFHPSLHFKKVGGKRVFGLSELVPIIERWVSSSQTEFTGFGLAPTMSTTGSLNDMRLFA